MKRRHLILILIVLSFWILTAYMHMKCERAYARARTGVDPEFTTSLDHMVTVTSLTILVTLVVVSVIFYELSLPPIIPVISALSVFGALFFFAVCFREPDVGGIPEFPIPDLVFDPFSPHARLFLSLALVATLLTGLPMVIYTLHLLFTRHMQAR